MKYEELHNLVGALRNNTAIMRMRTLTQHALHCRVIADHAWLANDRDEADVYYRSATFARRRAGQLNREIEP